MKCIYEAIDGKKFEYYGDCEQYEAKLEFKPYIDKVKFYDHCRKPIIIADETDMEEVLGSTFYIKTETEEEVEAITKLFEKYDYASPYEDMVERVGIVQYIDNNRDDYWENVEYEIKARQALLEELK